MVWSSLPTASSEDFGSGCLSHCAASRLAAGKAVPGMHESVHLASCASCRAQLVKAQRAHDRALSPALLSRPRGPAQQRWLRASMAAAALATVMVVLVLRAAEPAQAAAPRSRLTGEIQQATGASLHLSPLTELVGMGRGDQLRLRVRATEPMRAILSSQDAGTPRIAFDGVVPVDGVLPVTVEATEAAPPHLRLDLCPLSQVDTACDTFDLR